MYLLVVYVPEEYKEKVKSAMFDAGAGKIGNYSQCSWEILGQGQFLPSEQASPFLGTASAIEKVPEYRIELVCEDVYIEEVVSQMKDAHPYEEPAFHYFKVLGSEA
jgi:structural hemagglutinin/hemolysin toxin protein RtxA